MIFNLIAPIRVYNVSKYKSVALNAPYFLNKIFHAETFS